MPPVKCAQGCQKTAYVVVTHICDSVIHSSLLVNTINSNSSSSIWAWLNLLIFCVVSTMVGMKRLLYTQPQMPHGPKPMYHLLEILKITQ